MTTEDVDGDDEDGIRDEELLFLLLLLWLIVCFFGWDNSLGEEGIDAIPVKEMAGDIALLFLTFDVRAIIIGNNMNYLKSFDVCYSKFIKSKNFQHHRLSFYF